MIDALGPARPSARSCGCGVSRLGPPALLPPAPSPSRARAVAPGLAGRQTCSGKGSVFCSLTAPSATAKAARPLAQFTDVIATMRTGRRHLQCFAVNPERPMGVRGQN